MFEATNKRTSNQSITHFLWPEGARGLQLAAVGDLELRARTARLRAVGLQSLHDFHALHHLAEHHVMTVQMGSGDLDFTALHERRTVVMKNCEPLVLGPAFAMDSRPARSWRTLKFSSANLFP